MLSYKILVVDDDPDDLDIIRESLEKAGMSQILTLSSAQEVFTYLQSVEYPQNLPSLIIADLNMPIINGCDLLQALHTMSRYQHIPVVICSTTSHVPEMSKCMAAGASLFLTKPSSIEGFDLISRQVKPYILS